MKKLPLLLMIACLMQGLTACGQHKYNPEAIKLNDSAVALVMDPPIISNKGDTSTMTKLAKHGHSRPVTIPADTTWRNMYSDTILYEKAIALLDEALKIDSNYISGYVNKYNFAARLKRHTDALGAAKKLVRLAPNDALIKFMAGKMYDETGDTAQAKIYYLDYLTFCNHKLDTMDVKNRNYTFMQKEKAFVLILLNQKDQAHEIFKKLYLEANDWEKDFYTAYMRLTRTNMLEHKELSVTVGDNTTSIDTLFPEVGVSGPREIKY
ncbi:MAG TPA: tetratricopeptide repeat protein [Mucilaginibacter sp.]|jgi:tetratricopeptide (TPR) repeat protein|nr:tetratricopeptide repeat protein [Mucilaginibacter sp.]